MNKITWILLLGVALFGIALVSASPTQVVKDGDIVKVNYILRLADGNVYDSTIGREPLEVTLGQGTLLSSFEAELVGMRVGESKTFSLMPDQAYGEYRPELVGTLNRSQLAENLEPKVGKQVQTEFRDGTPAIAYITSFTDTTVTLDANHPLAGQILTFKVQLLAIGNHLTPASSNQTARNWLWLALGASAITGAFIFFSMRERQFSTTKKKRAGTLVRERHHAHSR